MPNSDSVGLCLTCVWVRSTTNRRGSVFFRCLRAETDPRFVRYPPLPVRSCVGYEPNATTSSQDVARRPRTKASHDDENGSHEDINGESAT